MFLTDLVVEQDPMPDYWILMEDLVWRDPIFGQLVVPKHFRSDLESVPVAVRYIPWVDSVFNPDGVTRRPAAAHDFLYSWRRWGKTNADLFLKTAILSEGAKQSVASTVYWGVRLFGQSSWDSDAGSIDKYDFTTDAAYQDWLKTQKAA